MIYPDGLAATTAAFERGYADAQFRQDYYQGQPAKAAPCGWDPGPSYPQEGLGYSDGPDPVPVYGTPDPGMAPKVLPVPQAFDLSAPGSVTGSSHAWGQASGPGMGGPAVVYVGLGDVAPPRRSLFARLLGRR